MPYRVPLTPKQQLKIQNLTEIEADKKLPEKWEDFARLCKIKSGNKIVQFEPYQYQIELSNLMDKYSNITVVKSRQLGITQAIVAKFLHRACLNPAYSAMIFLKNQDDSSNIARRARVMLSSLSEYVENESDNLGYMKIKGGGEIYFKNSSADGGRSYDSVSDFLFDEAAFSPNIESIYASSSSASAMVGDDSTKVIISTPSAKIGWYWDKLNSNNGDNNLENICKKVVSDELNPFYHWEDLNGDCKVIIHWKAHPIYSQKEDYLIYRKKQDGTTWEVINREYNLSFIDNEVSVFNSEVVRKNAVIQFEENVLEKTSYYIGVDTANMGNDYTVAVVLKKVSNEYHLINMYRKRKMTSDYDIFSIGDLIEKYKPKKVAIEVTGGTGLVYLEQLTSQYRSTEFEAIRTTGESKPTMIDRLILALEKEALKYPLNSPIVEEFLTYRRHGNKLEAASGKHDDCIMATAFALAVTPFKTKKSTFCFTSIATF